jgi:hypothetical protein
MGVGLGKNGHNRSIGMQDETICAAGSLISRTVSERLGSEKNRHKTPGAKICHWV